MAYIWQMRDLLEQHTTAKDDFIFLQQQCGLPVQKTAWGKDAYDTSNHIAHAINTLTATWEAL
jgi:hypothetical protein